MSNHADHEALRWGMTVEAAKREWLAADKSGDGDSRKRAERAAAEARDTLISSGYRSLADSVGSGVSLDDARAAVSAFRYSIGSWSSPSVPVAGSVVDRVRGWAVLDPPAIVAGGGVMASPPAVPASGGSEIKGVVAMSENPLGSVVGVWSRTVGFFEAWAPWVLLIALVYALGTVLDIGVRVGGGGRKG